MWRQGLKPSNVVPRHRQPLIRALHHSQQAQHSEPLPTHFHHQTIPTDHHRDRSSMRMLVGCYVDCHYGFLPTILETVDAEQTGPLSEL